MEFLIPLFLIASAIWGLFLARKLTPLLLGMLVIIFGSVFGPEFFSIKVGPIPITIDRVLWVVLFCAVVIGILRRRDAAVLAN